jgi:hypothetical protein
MNDILSCGRRGPSSTDIDQVTCPSCLEIYGQNVEAAVRRRANIAKAAARRGITPEEMETLIESWASERPPLARLELGFDDEAL